MADNPIKLSELPTSNTAVATDRLVMLRDPAGTPSARTVEISVVADAIADLIEAEPPISVTSNYQVSPGEVLYIDSTAGPITITAITPTANQRPFTLIDIKGTWGTNAVTFDPGAVPILVPGEADATGIVCSDSFTTLVIGYGTSKYTVI